MDAIAPLNKSYAAVFPTPFREEVKRDQMLLADGAPTEDFNGKKLNRIIEGARKTERYHEQQVEVAERAREAQEQQWDDRKSFGPGPRDIVDGYRGARRTNERNLAEDRHAVFQERVRVDEGRVYTVAVWHGGFPLPEEYQLVYRMSGFSWDHTRGRGGDVIEGEPRAVPLRGKAVEQPSGKPQYLLLKRTEQQGVYQVLDEPTTNRALAYLKADVLEERQGRVGPREVQRARRELTEPRTPEREARAAEKPVQSSVRPRENGIVPERQNGRGPELTP